MKKTITLLLTMIFSQIHSVSAIQKFTEYRIFGNELQSVVIQPQEHEAPASMLITIVDVNNETSKIEIESDDLLDTCKERLESIKDNKNAYAQIVIHENGQTLNGILVTQCSVYYF